MCRGPLEVVHWPLEVVHWPLEAVLYCSVMCRGRLLYIPRLLLSLLLSPPSIFLLFSTMYLYFLLPASSPLSSLPLQAAELLMTGTSSALNSWVLHSCWLFPVLCVGVWPLWLMVWVLGTQREPITSKPHSD